ncbi:MAG: ribose-5-phosphate isomerase RpiA [Gammaproteobacteria bacterium]
MSSQDQKKRRVAEAALRYVETGSVVGVGTGSTANYFIEQLAHKRYDIAGAVASSKATEALLKQYRIDLLELNDVNEVAVYIDGADEATRYLHLIKGGGGAHTREKIVAAASRRFICIADDSKLVERLGQHPVPVEVIPMARSYVARQLARLGGRPDYRSGFVTDNGNVILDVFDLRILEPARLEAEIDAIPGVVANGICARRPADLLLIAGDSGIEELS